MSKHLFILNDAPYGSERSYNALRLAEALAERKGAAERGTLRQLADWSQWADRGLVF